MVVMLFWMYRHSEAHRGCKWMCVASREDQGTTPGAVRGLKGLKFRFAYLWFQLSMEESENGFSQWIERPNVHKFQTKRPPKTAVKYSVPKYIGVSKAYILRQVRLGMCPFGIFKSFSTKHRHARKLSTRTTFFALHISQQIPGAGLFGQAT